eukprot:NODE_4_length_55019_cov_0.425091.p14 type:complete len:361 gc:universal NODE_4_length_55019_cov_0.425091:51756-50674(-)
MLRSTRKVKVAILFGYSGTGFHGMQIQPDVRTIEQEMLTALSEAGLIAPCNANDCNKVNLMRCARTDKGVHALGQVINIKLDLKSEDLLEAKRQLNLILPQSFQIWDILPTTKSFHCKDHCSSRHYNYWLPTYILNKSSEPNDAFRASHEVLMKFQSILDFYVGSHLFHNFTNKVSGKQDKARRHMISLKLGKPIIVEYPSNSRSVDGEWMKVVIHGQSFMLHQIRKMMAMAIFIIRYDLDIASIFPFIFDQDSKVNIPKAPALGLLLFHPEFDVYHSKLERLVETNSAFESKPKLDFSLYEKDMNNFFNNQIFPSMIKEELEGKDRFYQWIKYLETEQSSCLESITSNRGMHNKLETNT